MDKYGIKATLYDFFGYFIPGIFFILLIFIVLHHINIDFNKIDNIFSSIFGNKIINFNWFQYLIFIILVYILGHILSTLSSNLIEKWLILKIGFRKNKFLLSNILSKDLNTKFNYIYKEKYDIQFNEEDFRICIGYVEFNKQPIYYTAFVFLSFYGMARCLMFSTILIFLWEIIILICSFNCINVIYILLLFLLIILFYLEYEKFYRYFKSEIVAGFVS